jgi:hypothetical protein
MNTPPPSRRKTTKSVAIRRPKGDPESTRDESTVETAPPPRERKATAPDVPRPRKTTTRSDGKAVRGPESARPRRDSRTDASSKAAEPPRRDTKSSAKAATTPPRSRRDSKAPKDDDVLVVAEAPPAPKGKAPFRTTGDLPEPEGTRYSVIPSPRSPKKPAR